MSENMTGEKKLLQEKKKKSIYEKQVTLAGLFNVFDNVH